MKTQEFDEKESLRLITDMINRTKQRLHLGNGNIMLLWGYLTVAVALIVSTLVYVTENPVWNWLWFLIWIIGGTITPHMARKQSEVLGVKTYMDRLSEKLWSIVGYCAIIITFVCLGFMLFAAKDIWAMELVLALLVVGIAESVQGMVIKENILVFGGYSGIISGVVTLAALLADIPLNITWYMPVFIASWICMMVIPGHILNAKARKAQ